MAVTRATPGWNIAAIQAPELWALGHTGKGVVVATMDTGVDLAHPDLRRKWRGGANSWFDPHGEEAAPYDALGHGTQAMGVIARRLGAGRRARRALDRGEALQRRRPRAHERHPPAPSSG